MPYINYYIRTLIDNPLNTQEMEKALNTIYNMADKKKKETSQQTQMTYCVSKENAIDIPIALIKQNVDFYGPQPVKSISYGCPGGQRGFSFNQPSLLQELATAIGSQSVIDFAPFTKSEGESKNTLKCKCPFCKKKVDAIVADGKITCPQMRKICPLQMLNCD